jgi:hypothetical protein
VTGQSYRIDPAAALAAVAAVRQETARLDGVTSLLQKAVTEATTALTGSAPATAAALGAVRDDPLGIEVADVRQYLESAADHVVSAVGTYEQGDDRMAAEIDRLAR